MVFDGQPAPSIRPCEKKVKQPLNIYRKSASGSFTLPNRHFLKNSTALENLFLPYNSPRCISTIPSGCYSEIFSIILGHLCSGNALPIHLQSFLKSWGNEPVYFTIADPAIAFGVWLSIV